MFGCIIFDFDGVLVNFNDYVDWDKARKKIVDLYLRRGITKDVIDRYAYNPLSLIANTYDELFKVLPKEDALKTLEEASKILELEEYKALFKATLVPGCEETLLWLRKRGIRMGITSSNSERIVLRLLKMFRIEGYFESVVGRIPKIRMKPYPEQIQLCLDKMKCLKGNAAFVAIDEDGIKAAKTLGIHTIVIVSGLRHPDIRIADAKADTVIESLRALTYLFENLR
jgi:beta-phosphoglucomutase-like phosphatase (HAD superfamily)